MLKKLITYLAGLAATLVLSNCTPSTPQARIQQDPTGFSSLSSTHQKLAEQGRIVKGMPKKAVFFAWGSPAGSTTGSRNGINFQRWNYTRSEPVYNNSFYGNYGYGFGRRYYGGPYSAIGIAPSVHYISRPSAYVEFRNDKVTDWERRQ